MFVNLLPEGVVRRDVALRSLRVWGYVGASLAVAGAVWCGAPFYASIQTGIALADVEHQAQELERLNAESARMQSRLAAAAARLAEVEHHSAERRTLSLLGLVGQAARTAGDEVRLVHLNLQLPPAETRTDARPGAPTMPAVANGPVRKAAEPATGAVTIDGISPDPAAITQLIGSLREAGLFRRVELKSATEELSTAGTRRKFNIDCRFQ